MPSTDWNLYYRQPYRTASLTRRITGAHLVRQIGRFAPPRPTIVELGGANSCFFDLIRARVSPREYHLVDNNRLGLELLRERTAGLANVFIHEQDARQPALPHPVDLALSVGLIEHFDTAGTRVVVEAHFDLLRPGGVALMTFPTPTPLYRVTRRAAEVLGLWMFHDERPLRLTEVVAAAADCGELAYCKILWPIVLTQYLVVLRKK